MSWICRSLVTVFMCVYVGGVVCVCVCVSSINLDIINWWWWVICIQRLWCICTNLKFVNDKTEALYYLLISSNNNDCLLQGNKSKIWNHLKFLNLLHFWLKAVGMELVVYFQVVLSQTSGLGQMYWILHKCEVSFHVITATDYLAYHYAWNWP